MTAEGTDVDAPTVIFLHIGKTAGTTLGRILRRHYRSEELYAFPRRREAAAAMAGEAAPRERTLAAFAELPEAQRASYRLLLGHTVFGIHELVPRPSVYFTMLRHPTALVPSQYRYVVRTPAHRHHRAVVDSRMSLEDYITSGLAIETDNSQTRAIAGDIGTPVGACGADMLVTARRNLEERFAVVGLTERFDESLIALSRRFGWRRMHYVPAKRAPRRDRQTGVLPATVRLIEERNALDVALWEDAQSRLGALVAGDDVQRAVARLRRRNRLYRPIGTLSYTWPKAVQERLGPARRRR
jgi:hypothetical protein